MLKQGDDDALSGDKKTVDFVPSTVNRDADSGTKREKIKVRVSREFR